MSVVSTGWRPGQYFIVGAYNDTCDSQSFAFLSLPGKIGPKTTKTKLFLQMSGFLSVLYVYSWQGRRDSNPRPLVLETNALTN